MARTVRDAALETRTARARLAPRGKPYYRLLEQGLHLGYRRNATGSGSWLMRHGTSPDYRLEKIGAADDTADPDGVAILSFAQAQAAARKRHVGAQRAAAGLPAAPSGPYTVADALADYINWLEGDGRGKGNVGDTRSKAQGAIVPKLGALRVDRLTRKQIEDWHHGLARARPRLRAKAGAKVRFAEVDMGDPEIRRQRRASANRVLSILKAALNRAWRTERVIDDTAWRRVKPFKGATASRARYLQIDQAQRLINAANAFDDAGTADDFRDMVEGALHSGARWSELCRMEPGYFNPDAGSIAVHLGKGTGKTRHIILNDDGIRFFTQAVARAHNRRFLFVRGDGEPWKTSWQVRPMKAACQRAGIKPACGFHVLRHTWASHAVMNGMPLLLVARNLGHRDERMVTGHYGHLCPDYASREIRRASPRFGLDCGNVTPFVKV